LRLRDNSSVKEDIGITPGSLKIYKVTYPGFKCSCPDWMVDTKSCVHIKPYKKFHFDPYWIEDNFDCYPEYKLDQFSGTTLDDLIKEFPRWALDYVIHNWLDEYSKEKLCKFFKTSMYKLQKLLKILVDYRKDPENYL